MNIIICMIVLLLIQRPLDIVAISFNNRIVKKGFTPIELKLLTLLEPSEATRGASLSLETSKDIELLVSELENSKTSIKDPTKSPLIDGCWKLLWTSTPGTNSPIQRTFTANSAVSVYQVVNLLDTTNSFLGPGEPDVSNVVAFGEKARLRVTALASTITNPKVIPRKGDGKILGLNIFGVSSSDPPKNPNDRIDFAFQEAQFEFPETSTYIPYPVPFKLLGDEAKGWIDSTYLSPSGDLRIAKGNKGTTFILKRASPTDTTARFAKAKNLKNSDYKKKSKVTVILPAQLCSEDDYVDLISSLNLQDPNIKYYTCKLNRADWVLGLLPSFFSKSYFEGKLEPSKTLAFYLKKVDEAIIQAIQENGDVEVTLLAHSIGGWVSRAWISEHASPELKSLVVKIVTLGSPQLPPPPNQIDQTRGLLQYITDNYPGAYENNVKYYSVIGSATTGNIGIGSNLINTVEQLLGYVSYSVLSGDGNEKGDGLIPVPAATLPGSELITIDSAKHSNFIPNPFGKSFKINVEWYGTQSALDQWSNILSK